MAMASAIPVEIQCELVNLDVHAFCTELQFERRCLREQQQQLEQHHHQLAAAAESITSQLQVMPDGSHSLMFFQFSVLASHVTDVERDAFYCYAFKGSDLPTCT